MMDTLPEWSGFFLERDDVAYLEISDSDDRYHRVPAGWTLADIDECPEHSSQIFRYVRTEPTEGVSPMDWMVSMMGVASATGATALSASLIRAMLAHKGIIL